MTGAASSRKGKTVRALRTRGDNSGSTLRDLRAVDASLSVGKGTRSSLKEKSW